MKSSERSKRRKKEQVKVEEDKDLDRTQLFTLIQDPVKKDKYNNPSEEDEDTPFAKLLQAINMRASELPLQSQFPKMDLTALYCLGYTIQEYARHLSTNILTQKLASENSPQLNTLFSQEELDSQSITAVIEHYKEKKPVKSITPAIVNPRPNIREEVSSHARSLKYHQGDPFTVDTVHGDTFYQKMLRSTDWENVLRKEKDPEAAAAAAQLRREKDAKRQAKKLQKAIKKEQEQANIPKSSIPIKQEYLPPSPPADIFDKESSSSTVKLKSKKTQKKRKRTTESFF